VAEHTPMAGQPAERAPRPEHPGSGDLNDLRRCFPGFRIWREITGDRVRYIARRRHPVAGPHTVVTDDLGELRSALGSGTGQALAAPALPFDPRTPNIARMYDYMIGGKDHYPADREAAQSILVDFPEVAHVARANRLFVTRAVCYVAGQGITQYIDIGAGLPTSPAVHETAQQAWPEHSPRQSGKANAGSTSPPPETSRSSAKHPPATPAASPRPPRTGNSRKPPARPGHARRQPAWTSQKTG